MSTGTPSLDTKFLRTLSPLASLSADRLDELASKSEVESRPTGRLLFRKGDSDRRLLYLLEGEVELVADNTSRRIAAGSAEAARPLSAHQPHRFAARATSPVKLLIIDLDLLELLQSGQGAVSGGYEVTEIDCGERNDDEWMIRFLQSGAFATLPAGKIQAILSRLEPLESPAGTRVVTQGDQDPYYYIIKSGRCRVTRRPAPGLPEIRLADLEAGDGFGEEALLTGGTRNATVSMTEGGVVMRLAKDDFQRLLVAPMVRGVSAQTARALLANEAALIDVDSSDQFEQRKVQGAINLPLSTLRLKLKGLHSAREYVVCCGDEQHSTAAVFLMRQHGLRAHVLKGGITALGLTARETAPASAPRGSRPMPAGNRRTGSTAASRVAAPPRRDRRPTPTGPAAAGSDANARLEAEIEAAHRAAEQEAKRRQSEARQQRVRASAAKPTPSPAHGADRTARSGLQVSIGDMAAEPARVRSVGNKTVLEAEDDIFVFQAPPPGVTTEPMPEKKPHPAAAPRKSKNLTLLPIEPARKPAHRPRTTTSAQRGRGAPVKALAAALVLGVGAGVLSLQHGTGSDAEPADAQTTARQAGLGSTGEQGWWAQLGHWLGLGAD